jgi:hypothetical protein
MPHIAAADPRQETRPVIFGDYPCCDGALAIAMPDKTPAFMRENCPHCGALVWHRLSRVESVSWTESDFLAEHDVDESTRKITPKPGTDAEAFDRLNRGG